MSSKIPYVISESHPDYKRPYLYQDFGTIDEQLIDTFFVEKAAEFIYDRTNNDDIKTVDDITEFWDNYFDEYYMNNSPWTAKMFIKEEWVNACPTNVEIFECLNRMRIAEQNDEEESEADNEDNTQEEIDNFKLTAEEQEIQEKMKEYLESEIDNSDLEIMSKMNSTEQIMYFLNKGMLCISSDKYKEKRELFYKFVNIMLRITERDIAITTEEMSKNHDEQISLKLNYLMNVYGSILEYKRIFNR